jgi:hypothetical protein
MGGKSTLHSPFLEVKMAIFFVVSQVWLHCIQIYLKNLAKVRWKIETYILIF